MEVVTPPKVIKVWQGRLIDCPRCECTIKINVVEVLAANEAEKELAPDSRMVLRCIECKSFIAFAKLTKIPGSKSKTPR